MRGYLKIILAAIIWGSLAVVIRLIDLPVPVIVFYRVSFAALTVLIVVTAQRKTENLAVGKNIYAILLLGAILALNWIAYFNSIRLTTIASALKIHEIIHLY